MSKDIKPLNIIQNNNGDYNKLEILFEKYYGKISLNSIKDKDINEILKKNTKYFDNSNILSLFEFKKNINNIYYSCKDKLFNIIEINDYIFDKDSNYVGKIISKKNNKQVEITNGKSYEKLYLLRIKDNLLNAENSNINDDETINKLVIKYCDLYKSLYKDKKKLESDFINNFISKRYFKMDISKLFSLIQINNMVSKDDLNYYISLSETYFKNIIFALPQFIYSKNYDPLTLYAFFYNLFNYIIVFMDSLIGLNINLFNKQTIASYINVNIDEIKKYNEIFKDKKLNNLSFLFKELKELNEEPNINSCIIAYLINKNEDKYNELINDINNIDSILKSVFNESINSSLSFSYNNKYIEEYKKYTNSLKDIFLDNITKSIQKLKETQEYDSLISDNPEYKEYFNNIESYYKSHLNYNKLNEYSLGKRSQKYTYKYFKTYLDLESLISDCEKIEDNDTIKFKSNNTVDFIIQNSTWFWSLDSIYETSKYYMYSLYRSNLKYTYYSYETLFGRNIEEVCTV